MEPKEINDWFFCLVPLVVLSVGFVGNVLVVIVLFRRKSISPSMLTFLSMSISDLAYMVGLLFRNILDFFILVNDKKRTYDMMVAYFGSGVYVVSGMIHYISRTHIVLIAVERCFAVFFPLKVAIWFSARRVKVLLFSVYIFWVVATIPWLDLYVIFKAVNPRTNQTQFYITYGKIYSGLQRTSADAVELYETILDVFRGPLFLVTINVCTIAIVVRLRVLSKRRADMTSGSEAKDNKDNKTTLVLMAIVTCANVFLLLEWGISLARLYVSPSYFSTSYDFNLFRVILGNCANLLLLLNSAINFFVYFAQSKQFRSEMKDLFTFGRK